VSLTIAKLSEWNIFPESSALIAGPCSAESADQVMKIALGLRPYGVNLLRAGVWKPRTRPGSFEGAGAPALAWVRKAGEAAGLPTAVEVAEPRHVEQALKAGIDVLWIGARTTANPFSVQAIADALKGSNKAVMIKNPVSPDVDLWVGAIERIYQAGIKKIIAIHRGFATSRKTVFRNAPQWRLPIELKTHLPEMPLICDPSHICGDKKLLLPVAQQAMDLLFDGLMIEVHNDPRHALSDAKQQITPRQLGTLLSRIHRTRPHPEVVESNERIKKLRSRIDAIDEQIIDLFGKRMKTVRAIGQYKLKRDVSTFQPSRWQEIMETRARSAHKKGLSEEFLLRVYQHIHEEALRQQEMLHGELLPAVKKARR